jgi:hypothetical protein
MAVGDGKHREYWTDREPARGRYAEAREHPLLVQTLKERIRHRVKLDSPDEDAAGLVTSDPYAPTVVLPRIRPVRGPGQERVDRDAERRARGGRAGQPVVNV